MNSVAQFKKELEAGRQGRNIGISTGMPKLDSIIYGIQRTCLYLLASDSGSGKTTAMLDLFVYNLFKNKDNKNISILLYSFEMSESAVYAKLLSRYIWDEFRRVITYEDIMSLTKVISDEDFKLVEKALEWLATITPHFKIYDKEMTPSAIYGTTKEWLRLHGEFITLGEHKEDYIEKDENQYKLVIIDHVSLITPTNGSKKASIDLVANYMIYFRNKCNITGVFVQQLNRNSKSFERKTAGFELLDTADLQDTSGVAQAANVIIMIYYPYREKIARVDNYSIQNGLKDRARVFQVVKQRFGKSDVNIVSGFYGEIGMFKELPPANQISDYSKYTELIKEEEDDEQIDNENENVFKL